METTEGSTKGKKAPGSFMNAAGNRNSCGGSRGGGAMSNGSKQYNKGHQQGKSGKPCREIYRPPSLRSKTSRTGGISVSGSNEPSPENNETHKMESNFGENNNHDINISKTLERVSSTSANHGNAHKPQQTSGSAPNSPLITRHLFNFNHQSNVGRSLNANAKEFQFVPTQQQMQTQQLANLLSQLDPCFYGDATGALLATSGVYSLKQSKSLGNNMNLLLQQQLQAATSRQMAYANINSMAFSYNMNPGGGFGFGYNGGGGGGQPLRQQTQSAQVEHQCVEALGQFNRLTQSKSSGSIPSTGLPGTASSLNKPRVRFDDEGTDEEANRNRIKNAESVFANMQLNDQVRMDNPEQGLKSPIMPPKQLQKSRTGFYLNMYTPQPPSPTTQPHAPNYPQQAQGILKQTQPIQLVGPSQQQSNVINVKRSRSFGSGSINHMQRSLSTPTHSVYSDFQISKWPKRVQETVTTAVTAVERVAARNQIEMVNLIFEAMLNSFGSPCLRRNNDNAEGNWRSQVAEEDSSDLSSAAVHIFLYFIQREKERTVMESLLNTCFATFQKLFGNGQSNSSESLANQCSIFLKFLSILYTDVKQIQRQNARQQGQTMDEMSFTLLALLCDSCLATLRCRLCNDPGLMGSLFTVMTSQGRDMEGRFPLKMKQLLAAVRDALLGLGPYSKGPLSDMVQKTLMQLIELHAANWALPASAVRYYYTNNSNSGGNKNSSGSFGSNLNS